jgi:hypothetical protein
MAVDGTGTAPTARYPYRDAKGQPAAGRPFPMMVICRWPAYPARGHGAGLKPGPGLPCWPGSHFGPSAAATAASILLVFFILQSPSPLAARASSCQRPWRPLLHLGTHSQTLGNRRGGARWQWGRASNGNSAGSELPGSVPARPPYERGGKTVPSARTGPDSRSTREQRQHIHA